MIARTGDTDDPRPAWPVILEDADDVEQLRDLGVDAFALTEQERLAIRLRGSPGIEVLLVGAAPMRLASQFREAGAVPWGVHVPPGHVSIRNYIEERAKVVQYDVGRVELLELWRAIEGGAMRLDGRGVPPAFSLSAARPWQPFPIEALPAAVRHICETGAESQHVDLAFWCVPALAIMAGCVGASRRVAPKADWQEPATLWAAIVAPSGAGKSPPLRALLRPVRRRDRELREQSEVARAAAEVAIAQFEAEKRKAAKRTGTAPASLGERPPDPPQRCCVVGDVTIEALATRLRDNPRGLLLAVDELGSWLRSFTRYRTGGGSDEQQWLSMHSAEPLVVDRQSAPNIYVSAAAVAIVGTIQPGVAARLLGAAQRESGLAARLLMAEPPTTPATWTSDTMPADATFGWARLVGSLLDLTHDVDEPRTIPLDADATAEFVKYHDENGRSAHVAATAGDYDLAAALSKLRGAAPRLALLFALARGAEDGHAELVAVVDGDAMRRAVRVARWFEGEARRLYTKWADETPADRVPTLGDRLWQVLTRGPATMRDLHRAAGRNANATRIRETLAELGARPSRMESGPSGGRPREVWTLPGDDDA